MSGDFIFNEMKTRDDVERFLAQVERRVDDQGEIAEIDVDDLLRLEAYKAAIDLGSVAALFKGTTRSKVDPEKQPFDWHVAFDGGLANFRIENPNDAEYIGFWASIYLDNEPYWKNNDPYECSDDQIGAIFDVLPEEEKAVIVELLSKNAEMEGFLRKTAGLPGTDMQGTPAL